MPTIEQICTAFSKIADLALALKIPPMNEIEGCWEYQIDEHWWIAVNGHKESTVSEGVDVLPYYCYAEFNGWLAGFFSSYGGEIVAGELASEDTFIKAIEDKIKRIKEYPNGRH